MRKASRDLRKEFRPLKKKFNKEYPDSSWAIGTFSQMLRDCVQWRREMTTPANHPAGFWMREFNREQKHKEARG